MVYNGFGRFYKEIACKNNKLHTGSNMNHCAFHEKANKLAVQALERLQKEELLPRPGRRITNSGIAL